MSKMYRGKMISVATAIVFFVAGRSQAGSLDPTNAPGPTMHTLEEIYQNTAILVSPITLSDTTVVVKAGCYLATTLTAVDADLEAANILKNVTIFGITGTATTTSTAVPQTGQKTSYTANDDGAYKKGMAWPSPRFTVGTNDAVNCVTDNLTGLVWARNAYMTVKLGWTSAIAYCEGLNYGGYTDWRLPNIREMQSLIDYGRYNPALPAGHPFISVQLGGYWTSSSGTGSPSNGWKVQIPNGNVNYETKTATGYVWPVRGGQ